MKKTLAVICLVMVAVFAFMACSNGSTGNEAVDNAVDEVVQDVEDAADKAEEAVETAAQDAEADVENAGAALEGDTDVAILVPNADHGWTGAVLTYAEEEAQKINDEGEYTAKVITATDAANQISQIEDLIQNKGAKTVVILPHDNTVESAMRQLADAGIPFVMFDRIIDSVSADAIANVKGDNEGIGKETADRFVDVDGLQPGDNVLIMPGDNSSVPEMRNKGFKDELMAKGWTQEQVDAIASTDYTGWSRSEAKTLFTNWIDSMTVDQIAEWRYIFTHDDEIAMGILEALKGSDIDDAKKQAFLDAKVNIGTSSGLNEMYSVLKDAHQKDYSDIVSQLGDLFTVTYDPAMIQVAVEDMVTYLGGGTPEKDHIISVDVVDSTNVNDFKGFGDAVAVEGADAAADTDADAEATASAAA